MTESQPSDLIRSVSRALRIIEAVTRSGQPLPAKVIARRCQLHLSTAYHLVRTLCYEGYLVHLPDGNYVAGPAVAELSARNMPAALASAWRESR
ncbi:MAG TPA: helix-turn-helix domain-containing protein [Streptosporangiaceae bacterium]